MISPPATVTHELKTLKSSSCSQEPTNRRRIHIIQGQQHVDDDPNLMLSTILGSCVSACLRDPVIGVGGMNHFLLPGDTGRFEPVHQGISSLRYGVHAMELLVNGLLKRGAQRSRLEAKLFGGARMMKGLTDIGELNASFAEQFLHDEGIALIGGSLRGVQGRRIQYWPVSGRARQIMLNGDNESLFPKRICPAKIMISAAGEVDLF